MPAEMGPRRRNWGAAAIASLIHRVSSDEILITVKVFPLRSVMSGRLHTKRPNAYGGRAAMPGSSAAPAAGGAPPVIHPKHEKNAPHKFSNDNSMIKTKLEIEHLFMDFLMRYLAKARCLEHQQAGRSCHCSNRQSQLHSRHQSSTPAVDRFLNIEIRTGSFA